MTDPAVRRSLQSVAVRSAIVCFAMFGTLAAPFPASAQTSKPPRIGVISAGPVAPRAHQWEAFRRGLRELGYVEGQNVIVEMRAPEVEGGSHDVLAAELVRLKVDVIVAATAAAILAAKRATSTIPIVMATVPDAVGLGLVASLARPGGNVTGISMLQVDLSGKRLELVREIVPGASRVALLLNPSSPTAAAEVQRTEAAARALGMQLVKLEARPGEALDHIFRTGIKGHVDALVVISDRLFYGLRAQVAELALRHRLPTVTGFASFADAGGLLSYGASDTENYRRAATYVDRILKGAKPGDLPVEQPTKFELVINMKTAQALGIKISPLMLLRTDRVIE